jgi:hypothetical protein
MPMILRASRHASIATLEDAAGTLAGVAACFADQIGGLWTQVYGRYVPITAATAEFILDVSCIHRDQRRTEGPTHHIQFFARPGQAPVGVCMIGVGPNEAGGAAFGLRASLDAPLFKLDVESLLALTAAVADAMAADEAWLRPAAWANGPAGWAVLAHAAVASRASVSRRCGRGILVVLHDGAPTDTTSEAKQRSEAELSRVLGDTEIRAGDAMLTPAVAPAETPLAPPLGPSARFPPVVAVQPPAFLARAPAPLAGTALLLDIPRGSALPFAKSTGDQPAPPEPTLPRVNNVHGAAPRISTGTAFAAEAPRAPATPFQAIEPDGHGFDLNRYVDLVAAREEPGAAMADVFQQFGIDAARNAQIDAYWALQFSRQGLLAQGLPYLVTKAKLALAARRKGALAPPVDPPPGARLPRSANPLVVPDLSLADYAALRAHLMVRGEEDPETWKHFGVTSPAVKQALQDHFAARFRQDPGAQAQFVDRMKTLVAELRARATGR